MNPQRAALTLVHDQPQSRPPPAQGPASAPRVGAGRLSDADHALLMSYFCDRDGDAGLRSTFAAEMDIAEDAFVDINDLERLELAEQWHRVEQRLAKLEPDERLALEIAFSYQRTAPLERRIRLGRVFGGVSGLVEAHIGPDAAIVTARQWEHAHRSQHTLPARRVYELKSPAHALRVRMQSIMERAERAWNATK